MANRVRTSALTLGAILAIMGVFGAWLSVGPTTWSSSDLRGLVVDLGFSVNGAFEVAVRLWVLIPVLMVLSVVAGWLRRTLTSSILGLLGGLYAGVVALVVTQAPSIKLFSIEWGVYATLVGSVVVLVTSIWGFFPRGRGTD